MTRDDIIRMARECDIIDFRDESDDPHVKQIVDFLEAFAKMVAVAEREACANLCTELEHKQRDYMLFEDADGCDLCAISIRTRGDK